jgi:hypothetical protein
MRRSRTARPPVDRSEFAGFRFPPEVITVAVRWYLRYGLSYRDVEELLAERGIEPVVVEVRKAVLRSPGEGKARAGGRLGRLWSGSALWHRAATGEILGSEPCRGP